MQLPAGRYLIKIYVDRQNRTQSDRDCELGDAELYGQVEIDGDWPPVISRPRSFELRWRVRRERSAAATNAGTGGTGPWMGGTGPWTGGTGRGDVRVSAGGLVSSPHSLETPPPSQLRRHRAQRTK